MFRPLFGSAPGVTVDGERSVRSPGARVSKDQPKGVPRRHKSYADTLAKKKVKADSGPREIRYSSNPEYLTIDEAAYMAKVSMDRIYRWIQSGKIPALKVAKRVTRIPRSDFEMFLEEYMKQDKE